MGDALGLPAEGLRAARIARMWPGELKHRFVFGRGMMSDDTEHQFLTGQALLEAGEDVQKFRKALGRRLRWWLLAFPAGVGLATARALFKLWLGWPPARSGVYSAGNGPAMRSAVIGARFADEPERLRAVVAASTYLTHRDPRALTGAMAVAVAAAALILGEATASSLFPVWRELAPEDAEWQLALVMLEDHLSRHASVGEYAPALGGRREVSGYIYRTVPVALYAWLRHCGDYAATLSELIRCGGDSDTVAAIAGALAGAEAARAAFPSPGSRESGSGQDLQRSWRSLRRESPMSTAGRRCAMRLRSWCRETFCSSGSCCATDSAGCCLPTVDCRWTVSGVDRISVQQK